MRKIKVLLASRPKMLSDVIRNMVERQPDMEVAGEVLDPIELLLAVRAMRVDVVIVTPLDSDGESRICRLMLAEHPQLKIVTMLAKDDMAFFYESGASKKRIDEPSELSILGAIRESMRSITG
jgi:DNA-binding NarL/FixJ family response regulator